jgi:hypothetical protein
VELTCRHIPDVEIRYTLDGSEPNASSGLYRGPIRISETTVLRTAGFRGETRVTHVSSAQYWKIPPTPPPPDIFLSDLPAVREFAGAPAPHSYAVQKLARFDHSVDRHVLSNRDRRYVKGIGVQAPSELVFELRPEYKRFVALAGVDDECMQWDFPDGLDQWPQWSKPIHGPTAYRIAQIVFRVEVDDVLLAETPPMGNGDRAWGIDIEIPQGAHHLKLCVYDEPDETSDLHGHGDWLYAGFLPR